MDEETPTSKPLRLSDEDRSYHTHLIVAHNNTKIALDSWGAYIMQKYGLTPYHAIAEDGRIMTPEDVVAEQAAQKVGS